MSGLRLIVEEAVEQERARIKKELLEALEAGQWMEEYGDMVVDLGVAVDAINRICRGQEGS